MSLIKKLKRITIGRIEAFLDSLEDPAYILPQLQKEIAAKLDLAINAQAKALTAVKSNRRKLDEIDGKLLRMEKLAIHAVEIDDQKLARKVVSSQIKAEQDKDSIAGQLETAEKAYLQSRQVSTQLKNSLDELKRKSKELKQRKAFTKQMQKINQSNSFSANAVSNSILDAVIRMEDKIIEKEAEIETRLDIDQLYLDENSIDEQIDSIEIEKRLENLKNNIDSNR